MSRRCARFLRLLPGTLSVSRAPPESKYPCAPIGSCRRVTRRCPLAVRSDLKAQFSSRRAFQWFRVQTAFLAAQQSNHLLEAASRKGPPREPANRHGGREEPSFSKRMNGQSGQTAWKA